MKVMYERDVNPFTENGAHPGGVTVVLIDELKSVGISVCSEKDSFQKRVGRESAESRAFWGRTSKNEIQIVVPILPARELRKNKARIARGIMHALESEAKARK